MVQVSVEDRQATIDAWRATAIADGHAVPSVEWCAEFVADPTTLTPTLATHDDPVVRSWARQLTFFNTQWKFGMKFATLDAKDRQPDPVEGAGADDESDGAPRLAVLKGWLDGAVQAGLDVSRIRASHLKEIAESAGLDAMQIASKLPGSASRYADAILDALRRAESSEPETLPEVQVEAPPAVDEVESAPTSSAATPRRSGNDVSPTGFAPYDSSKTVAADLVAPDLVIGTGEAGELTYSWARDAAGATSTLYRVVSSDDDYPTSPDNGTLIQSTMRLNAVDDRPFRSAVRFVQVWVNTGRDENEAKNSRARLVARSYVVAPPKGITISEDQGKVIGNWSTFPGITRVHVDRVSVGRASGTTSIGDADGNVSGFIDQDVERGAEYDYRIASEAFIDGRLTLSEPVTHRIVVSEVLDPVTDLVVDHDEDADVFDLVWTPPSAGEVKIYRTTVEPSAEALRAPIPLETLQDALRDSDVAPLGYPAKPVGDGRMRMAGVPWPKDATAAYLTPVTIINELAFVGTPRPISRVLRIRDAKIVERVSYQLASVTWPAGAASVMAYVGAKDQPFEELVGGPSQSIDEIDYVVNGGFRLKELPRNGCKVHFVPVAYLQGRRIEGPHTSVDYPGLVRIMYEITPDPKFAKGPGVSVEVASLDQTIPGNWRFTLVYHPDRLPLSIDDTGARPLTLAEEGQTVVRAGMTMSLEGIDRTPSRAWRTPASSWPADAVTSGFIRLFVTPPESEQRPVALIDRDVSKLRVAHLASGNA